MKDAAASYRHHPAARSPAPVRPRRQDLEDRASPRQLRGSINLATSPGPAAYECPNYMLILQS
jgi:hypothetical protein